MAHAQKDLQYQRPPGEIAELMEAPKTPQVVVDNEGKWMLLLARPSFPPIEEVAQEELRIAGIRINPKTNGQGRDYTHRGITYLDIASGEKTAIEGLPKTPRLGNYKLSPDTRKLAFTHTTPSGLELWVLDIAAKKARKVSGPVVNDALRGGVVEWLPNSKGLVYRAIDPNRGNPPKADLVPQGPVVQENTGTAAAVRTYQDLLENAHDVALFKYYTTTQLMKTDLQGNTETYGEPGIITSFDFSPNGEYMLMEIIHGPFSYVVPYSRFPKWVELWDASGKKVKRLWEIPLAEDIPKGFGSVRKGPRSYQWRADAPAEIFWTEAQDEGDAFKEATVREQLYKLTAPFTAGPEPVIQLQNRFGGISWGNGQLAIINEWWWANRKMITSQFAPDHPEKEKQVIFDRSFEDRYNAPGQFLTRRNDQGKYVLYTEDKGNTLYLQGQGASPEGNRPFIDRFDLESKDTERLWRSQAPYYEVPIEIIDLDKQLLITRRESVKEPPNYYLRNLKRNKTEQITDFPHPYPDLKSIQKQLLKYEREDGVKLTAKLYLPYEDEAKNKDLPVLMWAYPQEYKSAQAAGQVKGSPYRFDRLAWYSPLVWLTQGYAVLDDPSMPIVGEGEAEPNDRFREQLVGSAQAAVDKLVELGVADKDRIAIGGHSYGAFMTANLLAHSDLFAAGIARSGAYNRTLTPYGFQSEERTYWEAPEVYYTMSPFMHADKIDEPLLLVHGQADNNSGTYPMQSERFYSALKGQGATVRLVMLPAESHSYRAKESIMHMLWETHRWLEKYVK